MLSLVVVAVDDKDTDLGYQFDASFKADIEKIPTKSFTAEYNLTSGDIPFEDLEDTNAELKPYVLLRYALNAAR
jgi:meiotically up-regulated gene 157 (Mug157) protein